MVEFTLTPKEIAFRLAGGDGTQASYKSSTTMRNYLEVLHAEDWAARREAAVRTVGVSYGLAKTRWLATRRKPFPNRYGR